MSFRPAFAALAITFGCKGAAPKRVDPHSFAEPDRVVVRDLVLDLTVDFPSKTLSGTARLALDRIDKSASLVLDSDGLQIAAVTDCAGKPLSYHVGKHVNLGEPVTVKLTGDCVEVAYKTVPTAGALMWLEPEMTAGGAKPMLFTQSQASLARTWIPLQDSPSVRFTYAATIHVEPGMWALMSAPNPQTLAADGVWKVRQSKPIPSYLMALAVGDFTFRSTGPRSGIYAEPATIEAAAYEFAEVEKMIDAAERLYGPYRWGRYDMLVLPPSFPFGGMENPNLTFLTPTVLTGDRALVSMIAHELAHSWSGNLVTNKTWNDIWLNEGFTTYVERRIMEELRGTDHAALDWYMGRADVDRMISRLGPTSPATALAQHYGSDATPDDIPWESAYDKGSLFLRTLELAYGRAKFDAFVRGWFDRHAFQSVDTKTFEIEARRELGSQIDLHAWLYDPGLPSQHASTPSPRGEALEALARDFATKGAEVDAKDWQTIEWVVFLRALPDGVLAERLHALDEKFHLTATTNAELSLHWLPRMIKADLREAAPAIEAFLTRVGRTRMVVPPYREMHAKNEFWQGLAKTIFAKARPRYHPITQGVVEKILAE